MILQRTATQWITTCVWNLKTKVFGAQDQLKKLCARPKAGATCAVLITNAQLFAQERSTRNMWAQRSTTRLE